MIFNEDFEDIWRLKAYAKLKNKRLQLVRIPIFEHRVLRSTNSKTRNMYLLNFGVQLYSKANGTPWILERRTDEYEFVREDSLVLGLSFGKTDGDIYYGVAQVIDLYGMTLRFEIFDAGYSPTDGYYIPYEEMEELIKKVQEYYSRTTGTELRNIYIYKSLQQEAANRGGFKVIRHS